MKQYKVNEIRIGDYRVSASNGMLIIQPAKGLKFDIARRIDSNITYLSLEKIEEKKLAYIIGLNDDMGGIVCEDLDEVRKVLGNEFSNADISEEMVGNNDHFNITPVMMTVETIMRMKSVPFKGW